MSDVNDTRGSNGMVVMAMRICSIVPNSASAERIFSRFAAVHTKARNRMTPERTRKIVILSNHIQRKHGVPPDYKHRRNEDAQNVSEATTSIISKITSGLESLRDFRHTPLFLQALESLRSLSGSLRDSRACRKRGVCLESLRDSRPEVILLMMAHQPDNDIEEELRQGLDTLDIGSVDGSEEGDDEDDPGDLDAIPIASFHEVAREIMEADEEEDTEDGLTAEEARKLKNLFDYPSLSHPNDQTFAFMTEFWQRGERGLQAETTRHESFTNEFAFVDSDDDKDL
ncbi:hypothetical protein C8R42DRAFT_715012 [Lentinula raphanica]|nr:hypothetical protein C8R42DRAFT_715012 [Lentinula raphanica]